MSNTYYMPGTEPSEDELKIDEIVFDFIDGAAKERPTIRMSDGRKGFILLKDHDDDWALFNAVKLFEALLKTIELGWFKPSSSAMDMMERVLRKDGRIM